MPQEKLIADFSGGMNASVAVDKLKDNECLLAENIRFDEQGNAIITGANTLQNASPLSDSIHSLFLDSALGAIAGAGTKVYFGSNFSSPTLSAITNSRGTKISFGAGTKRIYMDLSAKGYFKDSSVSDLVTVDWAPPSASSAITTGPNAGTYVNVTSTGGTSSGYGFSLGTQNMQGIVVSALTTATVVVSALDPMSHQSNFLVLSTQVLIVNGVPVGSSKTFGAFNVSFGLATIPFSFVSVEGNQNDLWGVSSLTPAQVNAANFGVSFSFSVIPLDNSSVSLTGTTKVAPTITAYQSASGFVANTGAAGTLTGTYTWKVTFTALNGEESDASIASGAIVLSAQQGTITAVPTGDSRTTGRNIYRKGGSLSSYYLIGSIPDNVSTTFSDNLTDLAALNQAIILAGDTVGDEPNTRLGNQAVKYPTQHYDRIFWASGNTLIWSKPLNAFAYPADFESDVGDGKDITGIFSMGGELFIIKPDTIWRLSGTDENSFVLSKTLSPVGTDWPFTAVISGGVATGFYLTGRIIFANSRGLWAFNGYTSNKLTPKLDLWFRQDDRTGISLFGTTGFHPPEIQNSSATVLNCAAANPLFYYLAYAEAGQSTPNAILVLDLERGAIAKRPFAAQSLVSDSVLSYIYAGNGFGNIVKLDDWTSSGSGIGGNVNMDFQDKYRDFGLRGSRFALWGLEFMIATNGQSLTPTVYFDDGTSSEALAPISIAGQQPAKVYRKLSGSASRLCRNSSFRLNYQGASVNSGNVPNIRLVHVKAYFEPREARARTGENP